jgi:hypothetical protein
MQLGARLELESGNPRRAAFLVGAFEALEERTGPALTPAIVLGVKNPGDEIRAALDTETLERMLLEGRQARTEDVMRSLAEEG